MANKVRVLSKPRCTAKVLDIVFVVKFYIKWGRGYISFALWNDNTRIAIGSFITTILRERGIRTHLRHSIGQ